VRNYNVEYELIAWHEEEDEMVPVKDNPKTLKLLFILTAFMEGISVLIVEIAGARALAPFYGTSLKVWTAQITATLLFLALGYWFGGFLSRKTGNLKLAMVFLAAGVWLVLFPFLRVIVLKTTADVFDIAVGSFLSAVILYGIPLLSLGAVSPLLIERLDRLGAGAGSAAGTLFFTNTMGGLAGGWLTALWLIPNIPLRMVLSSTGMLLVAISIFWGLTLKSVKPVVACILLLLPAVLVLTGPKPARTITFDDGTKGSIVYATGSSLGYLQVLETSDGTRSLMLNGAIQGGELYGLSAYPFTEYQNFISYRYHPEAKSALLLGLGAGILGKDLVKRGVAVTAVELEPKMGEIARSYFGLPNSVRLIFEDARTYLNQNTQRFDLVFLDVYAGENMPWYLATNEAMALIKKALNPGGCLVVNIMTWTSGHSPDLVRMEKTIRGAFSETKGFIALHGAGGTGQHLTNAVLVAGEKLTPTDQPFPEKQLPWIKLQCEALKPLPDNTQQSAVPQQTDDWSDLDYADADIKLVYRRLVSSELGAGILGD